MWARHPPVWTRPGLLPGWAPIAVSCLPDNTRIGWGGRVMCAFDLLPRSGRPDVSSTVSTVGCPVQQVVLDTVRQRVGDGSHSDGDPVPNRSYSIR